MHHKEAVEAVESVESVEAALYQQSVVLRLIARSQSVGE